MRDEVAVRLSFVSSLLVFRGGNGLEGREGKGCVRWISWEVD